VESGNASKWYGLWKQDGAKAVVCLDCLNASDSVKRVFLSRAGMIIDKVVGGSWVKPDK
jgi:hypothetical protein